MWQARHVQQKLEALGHRVELLGMTTRGDQILDRTLSKVGGKGLFVKELEAALDDGRADLAVHSLKDVPMELPGGFALACVMEREDPRDALVSNHHASLADLPEGAVVGTSSLRRVVLLREALARLGRTDVRIAALRGNLDTRLRKLDEGEFAAIVLAAAGLKRLELESRIRFAFEPDQMLPAAGQGALGIEVLSGRQDLSMRWRRWCTGRPGWWWRPSARSAGPWVAVVRCHWPRTPLGRAGNCGSTRPGARSTKTSPMPARNHWCAPAELPR